MVFTENHRAKNKDRSAVNHTQRVVMAESTENRLSGVRSCKIKERSIAAGKHEKDTLRYTLDGDWGKVTGSFIDKDEREITGKHMEVDEGEEDTDVRELPPPKVNVKGDWDVEDEGYHLTAKQLDGDLTGEEIITM